MSLDPHTLRAKLAGAHGRRYWRSLEELAGAPDFDAQLARELPRFASVLDTVDRRQFLKLMSASLALAGLGACTRQPAESVVPYVRAPEDIVPGQPLFFATAMPLGGAATGLLVESHMGRPTKVEGNPDHPASRGATDVFAQAAILQLYDPDRSPVITSAGEIRPWSAFLDALRAALDAQRASGGAGLRLLTETVTSPTLADQIHRLLAAFPSAKWHQYDPVASDGARAGIRKALGSDADAQYRFDAAEVIVSLDADFLGCGPAAVRHVRDFANKRRVAGGGTPRPRGARGSEAEAAGEGAAEPIRGTMNRLYVVESTPSVTGGKADHRLALRASAVEDFAWALATRVMGSIGTPPPPGPEIGTHQAWIDAVARDLAAHRGTGLVIAGEQQPAAVHALAHAMNQALGNIGRTVVFTQTAAAAPVEHMASLRDLVQAIDAESVQLLLILGSNPVFTAPADLRFGAQLAKVGMRIHLGLYADETALLCHWHVPEAHFLESWSDTRASDGTVALIQPLIAPLYDGRTAHELLAACLDAPEQTSYDVVRAYWRTQHAGADFEHWWRKALHDGVVPGTTFTPRAVSVKDVVPPRARASATAGEIEVVFRPDPTVLDGRFANNGWLQELPKPMTKITWENVALVSPATASRLGVASEDVVEIRYDNRSLHAPAWIMPGHANDSVTVHLGYGRQRAGRVGTGIGFDANAIRTSAAPWIASGVEIRKTGERHPIASTQEHFSMEDRHLVREATLARYREEPDFAPAEEEQPPRDLSLYPPVEYPGYAWGMAIDLNACTGCNACVIACQSENNIPVVGKDQVARGREMHWIRIDRYYEGDPASPRFYNQPVPCMQCENAPCEVVCPVGATVHSSEGLNDQVYNRCVGTKYCQNNCPYKVRRFNFYLYQDWTTESLKMARNPDVTVRSRGVMEKCTYCVQRINYARIHSQEEDRKIRDGEIVTACQQACPAEAIVFGDVNDPSSRVSRLKAEPRNYALLAALNTRPRTTYLASLRNPNPELERA